MSAFYLKEKHKETSVYSRTLNVLNKKNKNIAAQI